MTLQEIQSLVAAGFTKSDIMALSQPAQAGQPVAPVQQPVATVQQPVAQVQQPVVQPIVQQPVAQAQQPVVQPAQQPINAVLSPNTLVAQNPTFAQQLEAIGAALQQPAGQQPPATNVVNQPATTPANAGITPEEATKLFQAWSLGQATQNVELPPTADDVLARRFNSLYGVDITKEQK